MRRIASISFAFSFLLAHDLAEAANWVSLGRSASGKLEQETFIDVESIRNIGNIRRAWVKYVDRPHSQRGTHSHKWLQYTMVAEEFNCDEGTNRPIALYEYYEDNSSKQSPGRVGDFEPAVPGSVTDTESRYVCSWKG
jgi:hypothetical protein